MEPGPPGARPQHSESEPFPVKSSVFSNLFHHINKLPSFLKALNLMTRKISLDCVDDEFIENYAAITQKLVGLLFTDSEHVLTCLEILRSL